MLKQKVLNELKRFWNDEEAQGMMEYILMAVAVVAIATLVGPRIRTAVMGQADQLESSMGNFNSTMQ
jgi:Flp pilus assembly pilin Flp